MTIVLFLLAQWDGLVTEEIEALHLVNELRPTFEQLQSLANLSEEAGKLRDDYGRESAPERQKRDAALAELKAEMLKGCGHPSDATQKRVLDADQKLEELRQAYLKRLKALEKRLPLTEPQKKRAGAFQPALAPAKPAPKKPKDEFAEAEKMVEGLRNLPNRAFDAVLDPLLTALMDQFEPWKDMNDTDRDSERKRIRKLLDEARALSDLEFERQQEDLIYAIIDINSQALKPAVELTPAGRVLLNPAHAALYRARIECKAAADCASCAREKPATLSSNKPDFDELADYLGLDSAQREPARDCIGKMQVELLDLLSLKGDDGKIPLVELIRAGMEGAAPAEFLEMLKAKIPGRRETYFVRATALKLQTDGKLRKILDNAQFKKYASASVDLYGVRIGDLRRYDR